MPGCCLPSLTAATTLQFTTGSLQLSLEQEPTPCFAFLGGNSPLLIEPPGRSSWREKNTPTSDRVIIGKNQFGDRFSY
jgi:hypothetical protein